MQEVIPFLNIAIGIAAAMVYAAIGYFTQDKPFEPRKFLITIVIAAAAALGLDLAGINLGDPYVSALGPIAIAEIIQKIIRGIRNKLLS